MTKSCSRLSEVPALPRVLVLLTSQLKAASLSPQLAIRKWKFFNDLPGFNDKELLAIELADAMADTPANVSEDLYARLRNLFSEEQLLELGAHIAFENHRARLNRVFDVESDELYTPRLVDVPAHLNGSR